MAEAETKHNRTKMMSEPVTAKRRLGKAPGITAMSTLSRRPELAVPNIGSGKHKRDEKQTLADLARELDSRRQRKERKSR